MRSGVEAHPDQVLLPERFIQREFLPEKLDLGNARSLARGLQLSDLVCTAFYAGMPGRCLTPAFFF